ncbi:hypothetical protein NEOLEDRAFT_1158301 [Neolentinus lepideus HHB14362 ss-1]|uniref:RRM domain-containing protein n=1 Tax=Neolentinus lepideus HHB14362 ss-1 TaxID=1314782 RepID=A0A165PK62_9AGAM|nr:hypothetical protein NEOLEDRAFT_1158301 [Neolentinus lepideus HHB14362 ss-1]
MTVSSSTVTKRLHISGVTPSIKPEDLAARFQAFGVNATSVEGFDKLDAVGQPRGYGYVEVVGKEEGVKRCITALSGTIWKGAKLRIGDAKPDFRERLERDRNTEPKPRVKRRRVHAVHAPTSDLVTPDAAKDKKGYRVTETGRVVTIVRMRPAHPLGPTVDAAKASKSLNAGKGKKEKRGKGRKKDPPGRARRRTIDMVRYGSVYLKGAWLGESGVVGGTRGESEVSGPMDELDLGSSEASDSEDEEGGEESSGEDGEESEEEEAPLPRPLSSVYDRPSSTPTVAPTTSDDLAQEKTTTLGLLQSLFGDKDEWGGRASLSDIETEDIRVDASEKVEELAGDEEDEGEDADMEDADEMEEQPVQVAEVVKKDEIAPVKDTEKKSDRKSTKLKDLFAPREEEGGFSLLGHLDLDLELDEDFSIPLGTADEGVEQPPVAPVHVPLTIPPQSRSRNQPLTLDPTQPLFFPLPLSSSTGKGKGKAKDFLDVFEERGWGIGDFARREEEEDGGKWEEEARKRWEEEKGELTRGWKRRWREAGKVRRRRGGGDGDL